MVSPARCHFYTSPSAFTRAANNICTSNRKENSPWFILGCRGRHSAANIKATNLPTRCVLWLETYARCNGGAPRSGLSPENAPFGRSLKRRAKLCRKGTLQKTPSGRSVQGADGLCEGGGVVIARTPVARCWCSHRAIWYECLPARDAPDID